NFRLLNESMETLQEVAELIVHEFPKAWEAAGNDTPITFPERVEIRKQENEERLAGGEVTPRLSLKFREYVRSERRRELRVLLVLISLFAFVSVASVLIFLRVSNSHAEDYWRGWFDRGATALLVAAFTLFINLLFEYR